MRMELKLCIFLIHSLSVVNVLGEARSVFARSCFFTKVNSTESSGWRLCDGTGEPHNLQPKTLSESPALPEATHPVVLDTDDRGSDNSDHDGDVGVDDESAAPGRTTTASTPSQPAATHHTAHKPSAQPQTQNGTVGGNTTPPSPRSEEDSHAAEQRLAEVKGSSWVAWPSLQPRWETLLSCRQVPSWYQ